MKIINYSIDDNEYYLNIFRLDNMLEKELEKKTNKYLEYIKLIEDKEKLLSESLLYYYIFNEKCTYPLEQIMSGYFNHSEKITFKPTKDINGSIFIPNSGYINADIKFLNYEDLNYFDENQNRISFDKLQIIDNTSIELLNFIPPIISDNDKDLHYEVTSLNNSNIDALTNALSHIKKHNKDLFKLIELSTKYISLYKSDNLNSFASINYHKTCFINVISKRATEVFFIEDLAHQCGHIIFNILTVEAERYLNYPKDTMFGELINKPLDIEPRVLYGVFHGLFTYSCILECLDEYISNNSYSSYILKLEAIARIGFFTIKMASDLEAFYKKNILTELGDEAYKKFIENYFYIYDKYYNDFKCYLYANQPYIFDFNVFMNENNIKI